MSQLKVARFGKISHYHLAW